jgi:hypothetical protein
MILVVEASNCGSEESGGSDASRLLPSKVDQTREVRHQSHMATRPVLPPRALYLGYAGLAPQVLAVLLIASGSADYRFTALALAFAYAALIFSFLGGLWWGVAAADPEDAPPWVWIASVTPSLIALATFIPWTLGASWPEPSLIVLGASLIVTPLIDARLDRLKLVPAGWLIFRRNLSMGLGVLTIAAALL